MADETLKQLEAQLKVQQKMLATQQKINNSLDVQLELKKSQIPNFNKIQSLLEAGLDVEDERIKKLQRQAKITEEQLKFLDGNLTKQREIEELIEKILDDMEKQNEALAEQQKALDTIKGIYSDIHGFVTEITGINFQQFGTIQGIASEAIKIAQAFDSANVALAEQSGYTEALTQDMKSVASSGMEFGVGLAASSQIVGTLSAEMSLFAASSQDTRDTLATTAKFLEAMGVSASQYAQNIDILTRGVGMSVIAADNAVRDFDRLAQQLGVSTGVILDGFSSIGKELAKYGKQTPKVFADIAKEARKMGMSIQDAFQMADLFDTFEGAADVAGRLNAQIGLRLNSVELMAATEGERIQILQREFRLRGKQFDDMDRREQQAIARAMGVDVDMARRLFGDPVELRRYNREQKDMEERAKLMTTAMEKFSVAIEDAFISLGGNGGLIESISNTIRLLAANDGLIIKIGLVVMGIIAFGSAIIKLIAIGKGFAAFAAGLVGFFTTTAAASTPAAAGITATGTAAATAATPVAALGIAMLKLGAGVVLVGLGVAAAAYGIKLLAEAVYLALKGVGEFIGHLASLDPVKLAGVSMAMMGLAASMVLVAKAATLLGNPFALAGLTALTFAMGKIFDDIGSAVSEAGSGIEAMASLVSVTTEIKREDVNNLKDIVAQVEIAAMATRAAENNNFMEKMIQAVIGAGQAMTPSAVDVTSVAMLDSNVIHRSTKRVNMNRDSTGIGGGGNLGKRGGSGAIG